MSVFAGGCTLAAVEAICGDLARTTDQWVRGETDALDVLLAWALQAPVLDLEIPADEIVLLLDSLVSKSLVRQIDHGGEPRFMLLETMREYALERLEASGAAYAVRWRHTAYYAGVEKRSDTWNVAQDIPALEDELGNLREAMRWAIETGNTLPGLMIAGDFVLWGERANEGMRWLNMLFAHPNSAATTVVGTWAWYAFALLALFNADYATAQRAFDAHCRHVLVEGDLPYSLEWLRGLIVLGQGDTQAARAIMVGCAEAHRRLGTWPNGNGGIAMVLGVCALVDGEANEACALLEESLAFFAATDQIVPTIDVMIKAGLAAQLQGDDDHARVRLTEAIRLARPRRYRRAIVAALVGLAGLALDRGDERRAARVLGAADALGERVAIGDSDVRAMIRRTHALLADRLDPAVLALELAAGWALEWEAAVDLALG
jgi:hypothetical protein